MKDPILLLNVVFVKLRTFVSVRILFVMPVSIFVIKASLSVVLYSRVQSVNALVRLNSLDEL